TLIASSVSKAGMLKDMSNSFLFMGSQGEGQVRQKVLRRVLKGSEHGWHYSPMRRIPTQTVFTHGSKGFVAEKRATGEGQIDFSTVQWQREQTPVLSGVKVRTYLLRLAY